MTALFDGRSGGMLLVGKPGSGKSYTAMVLANAAAASGVKVAWVTALGAKDDGLDPRIDVIETQTMTETERDLDNLGPDFYELIFVDSAEHLMATSAERAAGGPPTAEIQSWAEQLSELSGAQVIATASHRGAGPIFASDRSNDIQF